MISTPNELSNQARQRQHFSLSQQRGTSSLLSQQLNQQRQRRKAAAGNLADALQSDPIGPRIDSDPTDQYYANRRQVAAQSLRGAMTGLNSTREPTGSVAYANQSGAQADNLHNRMASAAALGQRAGSPPGYTDQYNVTTRNRVGTAGPAMGNQDAITAGLSGPGGGRPSGPIAKVGLGRGDDGSIGGIGAQPMHAQGVTLSEIFSPGDDPARRAAFEASRDRRAARRAAVPGIRRQQMASQGNQMQVINPFMNPIAMQAMQQNPQLAFGAINDLNLAIQGRGQLQASNSATVADLNLRSQLGMGANQAASRTADANYLQAEAAARRQDAETKLLSDPSVRDQQSLQDALDMAMQSGDPQLMQMAGDSLRSRLSGQEGMGGVTTSQAPGPQTLNDVLSPGAPQRSTQQPALRAVRLDPETGMVPIDAAQNLLKELVSRGYQGEQLASEAARLGVSHNVMAEVMDSAPWAPRRFAGGLLEAFGLNPGYQRNLDFYDSLGGVLNRDFKDERKQRNPYGGAAANNQYFNRR